MPTGPKQAVCPPALSFHALYSKNLNLPRPTLNSEVRLARNPVSGQKGLPRCVTPEHRQNVVVYIEPHHMDALLGTGSLLPHLWCQLQRLRRELAEIPAEQALWESGDKDDSSNGEDDE